MVGRRVLVLLLFLVCGFAAGAKDKKKVILPADVLQAQTVLVVIDPNTGDAIDAPLANRHARDDVERALMNWGRFRLAMDASDADLIISVSKGNGKMAQPTIGGIPDNDRPVIFQPSESGPRVGGQSGNPPTPGDPTSPQARAPHPQVEAGQSEDTFLVYRGKRDRPLDSSPVWRYMRNDALRSPGVPAVDAFRKTIVEAEKQQAKNP
jgi:hypothetical protein